MTRLHRNEYARGCRADLATGAQLRLNSRAVVGDVDRMRDEFDLAVGLRRPAHLDRVLRGHHGRRRLGAGALHQVIGRGPVRVAVHERADDPAGQNAIECLMELLRAPRRDDLVATDIALHVKAVFITRTAAEADAVRRIAILKCGTVHARSVPGYAALRFGASMSHRVPSQTSCHCPTQCRVTPLSSVSKRSTVTVAAPPLSADCGMPRTTLC